MKIDPTIPVDINADTVAWLSTDVVNYVYIGGLVLIIVATLIMIFMMRRGKHETVLRFLQKCIVFTSREHLFEVIQHGGPESAVEQHANTTPVFIRNRLVMSSAKFRLFVLYMTLIPLQLAFLWLIVVESIFDETYSTESCKSFEETVAFNSTTRKLYYCRLNEHIKFDGTVDTYCNSSSNGTSFIDVPDEIFCTRYYRETSKWVTIIVNSVVWQQILSLICHFTIFVYLWLYNKIVSGYGVSPRSFIGIIYVLCMTAIPFLVLFSGLLVYLSIGDTRTKSVVTTTLGFSATYVVYSTAFLLSSLIWMTSWHSGYIHDILSSYAYPMVYVPPQRNTQTPGGEGSDGQPLNETSRLLNA